MQDQNIHVSDQELLLLSDGELAPSRAAAVRGHLEACWTCRTRMTEIEGTIADFVHVHHADLAPQLPPVAGPRAMLKARLADAAMKSHNRPWFGHLYFARPVGPRAYAGGALVMIALAIAVTLYHGVVRGARQVQFTHRPVPNGSLTPGVTRPVTQDEICALGYRDMNRAVPRSVQQEVFKAYGLVGARAEDYEVDYLITPELGGADNIQNLWPEPYSSNGWDAHVKDALEDRLHRMVCEGKIDLVTAQREMAGDWISAYKKYFHTDKPPAIDSANPSGKPAAEVETGNS